MDKPFFSPVDFIMSPRDVEQASKQIDDYDEAYQPDRWNVSMIVMANKCNAKVAPLIAENRRLQEQLTEASGEVERLRDENRKILKELNATTQGRENAYKEQEKLTEQNRELESIVSERVPKLEKILSIMKEALIDIGEHWCGYCPEHVAEDWKILLGQVSENRQHAIAALAAVKKLEGK